MYCYKNGYKTNVIAICANLAEEAKKNNEKLTVTGQLSDDEYRDKDITSETILEINTLFKSF
ncbi:MAG: hypothetical protein MRK01_00680 [Candidatus Scalindua sp.]|nr:hypothetical protein [Candidatus Scalindua sp.]